MKLKWPAICLFWLAIGTSAWGDDAWNINVTPGTGMSFTLQSKSIPKVLTDVPAYNWYHGCGPTAAGSIIGYYDLHGYDNLFTASGWSSVSQTYNVQDQISSPAHNAKYDPTPDDRSLPVPQKTSLACWFETSMDPQEYGWAYQSKADDAFVGYCNYRGYQCNSWYESYGSLTWQDLKGEIDTGHPMMFLVDTDGNGGTDHFVPILGYDDRGTEGKYYGCYTTWTENETIEWFPFQGMGNAWGVGYGTYLHIVPEPSTLVLLLIAALGIFVKIRRR